MADETKFETAEHPQTETKAAETKTETPALKYSDEQVNGIVAKTVAKETAKILALAGVKSPEELAALAKSKDTPDPVKAELDALKKSTAEMQERADKSDARAEAFNANVRKDSIDRVVKLAMSPAYEGTIAERIGKVLAEVPEFVDKAAPAFGVESRNQAQDAVQDLMNKARAAAGLPPIK